MFSRFLKSLLVVVAFECFMVPVLMVVHCFGEARVIPTTTMQPTITVGDRIFLEKVSKWRGRLAQRGAIICFYPPASEMPGGKDLIFDIPHILGRLTGLPISPYEPAFIKRIIGVAGDRIRVKPNVGVYINDRLVNEPYVAYPANYELSSLSDIGRRGPAGEFMCPYSNSAEPIVVPKGTVFVLGDNRQNSDDSHLWGFLPEDRIIGRAWLMFSPIWQYIHDPGWTRPSEQNNYRGNAAQQTTAPEL